TYLSKPTNTVASATDFRSHGPRSLVAWYRSRAGCVILVLRRAGLSPGGKMRIANVAALLLAIAVGSPASARDLRVSDIYPPESPTVQALAYMGVVLERQSFGRLRITPPKEADRD